MLWHTAWRDTRWRFLIGLAILSSIALANTLAYPYWQGVMASTLVAGSDARVAHEINSLAQVASTFRGYVWVQLVRVNLSYLFIVFAVLLGATGPFSQRPGAIFTLSLPISRRRVCAVRVATDLAELCGLGLIPMLLVPLAAPAIGYTYPLADALVQGIQILSGGAVFYCLSLWLATLFDDRWRPIIIPLAVAVLGGLCTNLIPTLAPFSPATLMEGESYFRTGVPAWAGICVWLTVSAAVLYATLRSVETRDF
jgi:hypothetical protein